ncbi:hypothetical protein [Hoeflea sp.]|uniref:hypothetical protein n=1 Tax=Hoeflea sp. TaxID=1940281 RepID=UPI003A91E916
MTLLSICIPVMKADAATAGNIRQMLESTRSDFEIVIADFTDGPATGLPDLVRELKDKRLRLVSPGPDDGEAPAADISACWNRMIPQTRGAWISIIGASDYAAPDIAEVITAALKRVPDADALSWGRAEYIPPELGTGREIARIPTGSLVTLPEQKDLMRSQFYWDGAGDRPACDFGVWHGAVRRELLERTREAFSGVYFEQAAPAIDNICKTVVLARSAVFWERPLSVRTTAGSPALPADKAEAKPFEDFPFSAAMGAAASAALAIEAFKRSYGIELDGWEDNFITACAHDCETETSGERFHARKAAYAKAIADWRGKRALTGFKPEFRRNPKLPRFQGVRDGHLHFNMKMGDTRTAGDFYRMIDAMLFPVHLLDDKLA